MTGHVFVVHGDLTQLACDAWLMPCGRSANVMPHWLESVPGWHVPIKRMPDSRVVHVSNWPSNRPAPWLVDTGGSDETDFQWYVEGVERFAKAASSALSKNNKPFLVGRSRRLLGVPLVGTGAGGAYKHPGHILNVLLPALERFADELDTDIALVLKDRVAYVAAQHIRQRSSEAIHRWQVALSESHRAHAERLAQHARQSQLVVFLGAGAGAAANVPSWDQLLTELAITAGFEHTAGFADEFDQLDHRDRAHLIERRFRIQGKRIGDQIIQCLEPHQSYSLIHAFVAAFPVKEFITTNYDRLFEKASSAIDRPATVLPYDHDANAKRWLLKLHGCLTHSDDIVLTRGDYLRYDERRAALRGIVQAMLITRHMLFVGFSLRDDNFHRIIDDVRKALRGEEESKTRDSNSQFGTSLNLGNRPWIEELWERDLEMVHFGSSDEKKLDGARQLEIFLDYVAACSVDSSDHLLHRRYAAVLTDVELSLKKKIENLLQSITQQERNTLAWKKLESVFRELGG